MKQQIILIGGAEAFDTYDDYIKYLETMPVSLDAFRKKKWKDSFQDGLGEDYDFIRLGVPNTLNAKYKEWRIYFERYIPLFDSEIILIGHSMGGIFLLKYLSENTFPKEIKALYLLAAPIKIEDAWSLADFTLSTPPKIKAKTFILHSEDDPVVPYAHALELQNMLPEAKLVSFKDKQHFNQPEFPELVELIKKL